MGSEMCIRDRFHPIFFWSLPLLLNAPGIPLLCFVPDQLSEIETCLLYTSDAADERSSVDLGGRRIIKKKTQYDLKVGIRAHHTNGLHTRTTTAV